MDCVSICGVPFCLQGPASPARAALAAMFACLPRQNASSYITLRVHQLEQFKALEALVPPWLQAYVHAQPEGGDVVLVYADGGDCAALAVNRQAIYCAWLSVAAQRICYVALKKTDSLTPLSVSSVLVPVLREFFATHKMLLLHAAAVRIPSGHGFVFLAESGGGKTTTALTLLRSGAQLLADDLVAIRLENGVLQVQGIAEALNLTPQTMAFFPEVQAAADAVFKRNFLPFLPSGKCILAADAVYAQAYHHAACRLHGLYVLQLGGEQIRLEPLGVGTAFGKLLHAHSFAQGQRPQATAMALCSTVLERVPLFVLQTGNNPQALGPWLMDRLAGPHSLAGD